MSNIYLPGVIQIPSALIITDMTRSFPMQITFSIPSNAVNTYIPGQVVKLNVPKTYGMFQANGMICKVLSIASTTMTVNIDSSLFDTFVYSPSSSESPASMAPAGSQNLQYNNSTNQVPFQSYNNIGN